MNVLKSYRQWNLNEEDLHSGAAMQDYKSGIDSDINLASEAENKLYDAYLERMETRLEKHRQAYEEHLNGKLPVEQFIYDISLTRRLFEDWNAFAQRLEKLCQAEGKKKSEGKR